MTDIKELYDYFQKSKVFLYPALGLTNHYGESIEPIMTYTVWKQRGIGSHHKKLMCLFYLRDDQEFKNFERNKILRNRYFREFVETEDYQGKKAGVYIFDMFEPLNVPADFRGNIKNQDERKRLWNRLSEKDKRNSSIYYSMNYNWDCFLRGQYSKLSMPLKKCIKNYYRQSPKRLVRIESFLYPEKYFHLYQRILNCDLKALEEVGELAVRPDFGESTGHSTEVLDLKLKSVKIKTV